MSLDDLRYLNGPTSFAEQWERLQKPTAQTRGKAERAVTRVKALGRSALRALVYRLDGGKCRRCGKRLKLHLKDCAHAFQLAHINEFVKRSLGGDPREPTNCITLCADCHDLVDDHKLEIVAHDPVKLMRGTVDFIKGAAA